MSEVSGCCTPVGSLGDLSERDQEHAEAALKIEPASEPVRVELRSKLRSIAGGFFDMGTRKSRFPDDLDSPRRRVKLKPYLISPTAVTNEDYVRFVDATGYQTVSEREGWSFVFRGLMPEAQKCGDHPVGLEWWLKIDGAYWAAPEGVGTDISDRAQHPVVHITWYDALAYCRWSGLSLPTEAQWEYAARGGLTHKKFPWGNEMMPYGRHAMNTWQGDFPHHNTVEDGFLGTAPVTAFQPNGLGMYNMTGNAWEWVNDRYGDRPVRKSGAEVDPSGPKEGHQRIQRGGSFLCHVSYCDRYHVHSRTRNDPDSSASHSGFRVSAPADQ